MPVDTEPPRKQAKHEPHFTPSDADESDALDTPTPAPSKKQAASHRLASQIAPSQSAAEARLQKTTPATVVDDMVPEKDRPAVARVLRIAPPQEATPQPSRPTKATAEIRSGPSEDKDGLTKKQRQNQKKKERHREARAREEAIRQSQLRAHQKELETIRLNGQIKAAEQKSVQSNVWQQSGIPVMEESMYTVRNLSDENLTTLGHPSDGTASEEGWQEVTSKAAKKVAIQKASGKASVGTDGSEELSSLGDNEESALKTSSAYASGNSFANLG
jgi:hypothetical protein